MVRFLNTFYSKLDTNIDNGAKILGPLILERLSQAEGDSASLPVRLRKTTHDCYK